MDMGKWSISMVTFIKENGKMIKSKSYFIYLKYNLLLIN
jgi:hypothetical protein